jgi:hypothetical protein
MQTPIDPRRALAFAAVLAAAALACSEGAPAGEPTGPAQPTRAATAPEQAISVFDLRRTAYGFFPSPPEATLESVLNHFQNMGEHADFILIQPNIPWEEFRDRVDGESQPRTDLRNQITLARQNGLEWVFVVDPLNGLNRREFLGLPVGWEASFANPDVRAAFTNFTLWVVREFSPRYLGLASEINTYLNAHPDDVQNYLSLYRETYDRVKAEAPETQVFVTFQWDELNNMFASAAEGRTPRQANWEQVEAFEPRLDLWVISSYPYFAFPDGAAIPADYYTPLLERSDKPLAVGEGGWTSRPVGPLGGNEQGQVAYLQAIHDQLGDRLAFWVYLVLSDFNLDSYREIMRAQGTQEVDIETLGMFAAVGLQQFDGTPKPALAVWDTFRQE